MYTILVTVYNIQYTWCSVHTEQCTICTEYELYRVQGWNMSPYIPFWHPGHPKKATISCTALHWTALRCTELNWTALNFTVLHCTVIYLLHFIVLQRNTIQYMTLHCHCTTIHVYCTALNIFFLSKISPNLLFFKSIIHLKRKNAAMCSHPKSLYMQSCPLTQQIIHSPLLGNVVY